MSSSRSAKKKRPLPVIDLGQLLGHSNAHIKSSSVPDKEQSNPSKKRQAPRMKQDEENGRMKENCAMQPAGLSHQQSNDEPRHPGASIPGLASMEGLSFYESLMLGPSLPCDDTSTSVEDASLAVAMSDAWKSSVMPEETFLPLHYGDMRDNEMLLLKEQQAEMQPHCFADSKMPAESHELIALNSNNEAQQQPRTDTPELLQADPTKADKVDDTKEGKVGPTATSTRQVMPNRNVCVPLVPVPSECSSTLEDVQSVSLPSFQQLINYDYFRHHASKDRTKTCVMCGMTRQYLHKKGDREDSLPFILRTNKGVCSLCKDVVWVVVESKIEIRYCVTCKAFHPWAAFQKDGEMVKKCSSCSSRERDWRQKKKHDSTRAEIASDAVVPTNAIRCVTVPQPVKLPPPSTFGEPDDIPLPDFGLIVNYPAFVGKLPDKNGNKICVMCSKSLPHLSRKNQNKVNHCIPPNNNGVCTLCEVSVWQMVEADGVRIKWCNQCNHFRPLVSFLGKDNKAKNSCSHCRRYDAARQKKKRSSSVEAA